MAALFQPALEYVLNWEDPKRTYEPVPDVGGSLAISGINNHAFPEEYAAIMSYPYPGPARAAAVASFYQSKFWNPMQLSGLNNQDIANRVMDMGVNGGAGTSIRLLQRCVCELGQHVTVDGVNGPLTLAAANAVDQNMLLTAFRVARVEHYEAIAEDDPEKYEADLAGWETRARA